MPVARLALAGAAAALVLTGCSGQEPTDDANQRQGDRPLAEPTIVRTPVKVSEAPRTVPMPGGTEDAGGLDDD